jgi:hypothetical protein
VHILQKYKTHYITVHTLDPTSEPVESSPHSNPLLFTTHFDIVECRPAAWQRKRDKQIYNSRNGFANKHVGTAEIGKSNRGTVFSVRSVLML